MYIIAGLGNYPKEYDLTRHNVGFMCVDNFVQKHNSEFKTEQKFKAETATIYFNGEKLLVLKPLTFMNLSGEAIQKAATFYKIEPQNIFIIYDDISLDLGKFRFRASGSDGGHNGIKSIIQNLGTDKFPRLKVGIGPQPNFMKAEAFVLQKFSNAQMETLNRVVIKSVDAIEDFLVHGITEAQNRYNGVDLALIQ